MVPAAQKPIGLHLDTQFFIDFTGEARLQCFVAFTLPPWKLPISSKTILQVPLCNKQLAMLMDDGASDINRLHEILLYF